MKLSLVTTLYGSEPYLEEFHARMEAVAREITDDFEFVMVNDGSPDRSLQVALKIRERHPNVRVIDLSRNFGHHRAIMAGLGEARGEFVFLIDCDLEEPPETLREFWRERESNDVDVAFGVRNRREESGLSRLFGSLFYFLFNALSPDKIPYNLLTVRLMTRRYVDALLEFREREMQLSGLWAITGFSQLPLQVKKGYKGHSSYTLRRKLAHLLNAVTSFSNRPLIIVFYMGLSVLALSGAAAIYLVIRTLMQGVSHTGWPSLIVTICFFGGLNLFSTGLVGIYIAKVYIEVKQRPYVIVRERYE